MTITFPISELALTPRDETARTVCDIEDCRYGELAC